MKPAKVIRAVDTWAYAQLADLEARGSRDWLKVAGEFYEHVILLLPQIAVRRGVLFGNGLDTNAAGQSVYHCVVRLHVNNGRTAEHFACRCSLEDYPERYADLLCAIARERYQEPAT